MSFGKYIWDNWLIDLTGLIRGLFSTSIKTDLFLVDLPLQTLLVLWKLLTSHVGQMYHKQLHGCEIGFKTKWHEFID